MFSKIASWLSPVDKAIGVIDQLVLDKDKDAQVKLELVKIELDKLKERQSFLKELMKWVFPMLVLPLAIGFGGDAIRMVFGLPKNFIADPLNVELAKYLIISVLGKQTVDNAGKIYEKTKTK